MTTAEYLQERPAAKLPGATLPGLSARKTPLDDLLDWFARLPWCWPALATLILGLYQMGRPELWRDELASWSFATRPIPAMVAAARKTGATQLAYYLLLHFWIRAFGDSPDAMRSLSVLAMAGAAACVALIGRRLAGARAGLLSGLVFALVPSVSRFAQEVRFYALEVLVATLATLLLLRALDHPSRWPWLSYAASLAVLGYVDIVALSVVAGHAVAMILRCWRSGDNRQLWFVPAAVAGVAACLPLAVLGASQAHNQLTWIARPGMDLAVFSFFARNLFYSTSVAAALIVLAILAWAVAWEQAAFAAAIAVVPVATVWLVSQGTLSYFFPRYLLLTVGAWAVLAGIGLSRLDARLAVAAVCVVALLGAGDQQVIREAGAHDWPTYPVGTGSTYPDFADASQYIADHLKTGDGIIYQGQEHGTDWLMIGFGIEYYLGMDLRSGTPLPHVIFQAETATKADALFAVGCKHPARCLGHETRIWIVGSGHLKSPYRAVTTQQAALLRPYYRVSRVDHVNSLTVFLLVKRPHPLISQAHPGR